MGERRIGSHTHRLWSSGRLGKKMLPLRASVGSTEVFRTDARRDSAREAPARRSARAALTHAVRGAGGGHIGHVHSTVGESPLTEWTLANVSSDEGRERGHLPNGHYCLESQRSAVGVVAKGDSEAHRSSRVRPRSAWAEIRRSRSAGSLLRTRRARARSYQ